MYDEAESKSKYYIARKGMMKFFDMRLGFVSKLERNELNENKHGFALT